MTGTASLFSHFISTRGTFRWLSRLVIVSAAFAWVAVGYDVSAVQLFGRDAMGLATASDKAAHLLVRNVVLYTQLALLLTTAVAFTTWLYRSRANLRAFGARELRFSRNWTVFAFLIPGLNLVRPYQVVREVWQASDPSTTDPFGWKQVKPPLLFRTWWVTFVVFVVMKPLAIWMGSSALQDPLRLQIARGVELLADVMAAVSVTFVYFIIERITEAQETKWGRLGPPPGTT